MLVERHGLGQPRLRHALRGAGRRPSTRRSARRSSGRCRRSSTTTSSTPSSRTTSYDRRALEEVDRLRAELNAYSKLYYRRPTWSSRSRRDRASGESSRVRGADYVVKRVLFAFVTRLRRDHAQLRPLPGDLGRRRLRAALPAVQPRVQGESSAGSSAWTSRSGSSTGSTSTASPTATSATVAPNRRSPSPASSRAAQEHAADDRARDAVLDRLRHRSSGVISAWRRGTFVDKGGLCTSLAFYSMPTQWLGLMMILFVAGRGRPADVRASRTRRSASSPTRRRGTSFVDRLRHMILPALTLGLVLYGDYALIVRSAHARDARRGLRADRPGQGPHELDDRAQARVPERAAADRHAHRALARVHHRRLDHDRVRLLLPGHRARDRRGDRQARLPAAAGDLPAPDASR